jgi:hypothetical protein
MDSARFFLAFATLMVFLLPARAGAETYTFSYCLENNSGLCEDIASQLKVEVTLAAVDEPWVNFTFTNEVGITSSITDLYFDATGFFDKMKILTESAGVNFELGANPSEVPGAGEAEPDFVVSTSLSADSEPPRTENGINADGESLTISFKMAQGVTFDEVIDALNLGPGSDEGIRIAAHLQGVGPNGESDSLICCTPGENVIPSPEPAVLALFGMGLFAVGLRIRRKKSQ